MQRRRLTTQSQMDYDSLSPDEKQLWIEVFGKGMIMNMCRNYFLLGGTIVYSYRPGLTQCVRFAPFTALILFARSISCYIYKGEESYRKATKFCLLL